MRVAVVDIGTNSTRLLIADVDVAAGAVREVERPEELRPALERAFESGKPACVNVLTDPSVIYPRSANLA